MRGGGVHRRERRRCPGCAAAQAATKKRLGTWPDYLSWGGELTPDETTALSLVIGRSIEVIELQDHESAPSFITIVRVQSRTDHLLG
jgi:hypothetical protein